MHQGVIGLIQESFSNRLASLWRRYRFVAVFIAIFAACQLTAVSSRIYIADWLVAAPAGWTLAALFPTDEVSVVANRITSTRARLNILPGCEGTELFFLLIAGVLATPARWRGKLSGLGIGLSLAFALNQIRVAVLYWVVRDHAAQFELVHGYLAPTALVIGLGVFFHIWSAGVLRPGGQ